MEAVRFYYDVVCPYSYMESHAVEAAEDDRRVAVEWLPYELRPAPAPLLEPRGDHLRVDWTRHVYRRALERGIEIHLPRYQPRSTLVLAACLWAGDEGRLRAFKHALYEAFFCEGVDIATDTEIARCAETRRPLRPTRRSTRPTRRSCRSDCGRSVPQAQANGVAGVPSLLTPTGARHWGMGGVERLLAGEALVPRT